MCAGGTFIAWQPVHWGAVSGENHEDVVEEANQKVMNDLNSTSIVMNDLNPTSIVMNYLNPTSIVMKCDELALNLLFHFRGLPNRWHSGCAANSGISDLKQMGGDQNPPFSLWIYHFFGGECWLWSRAEGSFRCRVSFWNLVLAQPGVWINIWRRNHISAWWFIIKSRHIIQTYYCIPHPMMFPCDVPISPDFGFP
jgi:hypothetical protein